MEEEEKIRITIIEKDDSDLQPHFSICSGKKEKKNLINNYLKGALKSLFFGLILAGLFSVILYVFATPPTSKYDFGETLDPNCTPGSTNCSVVAPAQYSFSSNNFSGTGNFTTTGTITAGTLAVGTAYTFPITDGTNGQALVTNGAGVVSWSTISGSGAVDSVSNSDGTLTISPTTGNVIASLNLGNANTWTAVQSFPASGVKILEGGSSPTLYGIFAVDDLSSSNKTYTFPDASGTVALGTGSANQVAYWSNTNTLSGITSANNGVLVTNASGVPSIATDIPTAVTIGGAYIYRVGGTDVAVSDGGTGKSSWTQYAIPYLTDSTTFGEITIGESGKYLKSTGTGYSWDTPAGGGPAGANYQIQYYSNGSFGASLNFAYDTTNVALNMNQVRILANKGSSGAENLFLGQSGNFTMTGSSNIFAGYNAGHLNTLGSSNNFFGFSAGFFNDEGSNNNFLGYYAGFSNTSGSNNNFLGYKAGLSNTSGSYNNFLGYYAGHSNNEGSYNNFLGFSAGSSNTSGNYNTFIGAYTGILTTTGSNDVFLGYQAGYYNTEGSRNVFLGNYAGYHETGSDKLFIDDRIRTSEEGARTEALIYGVFNDAVVNQVLTINAGTINFPSLSGTSSYNLVRINTTTGQLFYDTSTARNKKDISVYQDDFNKILNIQPQKYTDVSSGLEEIGYIAEDFDALGLNNLVIYGKDGLPIGLKYERIPLYILEVVKRQQTDIAELKQQLSINNITTDQTGTIGSGAILGVTDQSVQLSLSRLGASLIDGIMSLKQIIVDSLTAKTAKIERLEMVDQSTGEVYCTWIENGEWQKVKGECATQQEQPQQEQPQQEQPQPASPEEVQPTQPEETSIEQAPAIQEAPSIQETPSEESTAQESPAEESSTGQNSNITENQSVSP